MSENQNKGNNMTGVARSALILGCAMVFSQICGLLSKSILGSTFGASSEVDAYLASNRVTELIQSDGWRGAGQCFCTDVQRHAG